MTHTYIDPNLPPPLPPQHRPQSDLGDELLPLLHAHDNSLSTAAQSALAHIHGAVAFLSEPGSAHRDQDTFAMESEAVRRLLYGAALFALVWATQSTTVARVTGRMGRLTSLLNITQLVYRVLGLLSTRVLIPAGSDRN